MRARAASSVTPRRSIGAGELASYGLVIGAVVLGWQIAIQPLVQRAPAGIAIQVAPGSPQVLRRAAEAELAAGRMDNAAALSRDALVRSPFNVGALRVFGLTEARAGREDAADEILTLAGNWSLRDDAAHAWLVERRLRRGDYVSSFAHADTLVRRREDIQPQVFRLFTVAATQDPQRALPVIARLLAVRPPWRAAYLAGLNQSAEGLQVAANLAVLLQTGRGPLTNGELQGLYSALIGAGGVESLEPIRARLNRPPLSAAVTNGGFEEPDHPGPFQWRLYDKAGIVAELAADDLAASNTALRVDYDGYASGIIAEQLTTLTPGAYRFTASVRTETGDPGARLAWVLSCASNNSMMASTPAGPVGGAESGWQTLSGQFEVAGDCTAQWLRLETRADDRRAPTLVWFDRIRLAPSS